MIYNTYYGIRPKPELRDCPDIAAGALDCLWDESVAYENEEGGRSYWSCEDHITVVKILFLAERKTEYGDEFFPGLVLGTDSFDRWWTLERYEEGCTIHDTLDNIDATCLANIPRTGRAHVDTYLTRLHDADPRTTFWTDEPKYRIRWNGDVIGWIEEPAWDLPYVRGKWVPTINRAGKEFASQLDQHARYQVVVDGDKYLQSELTVQGDAATARVALVTSRNVP